MKTCYICLPIAGRENDIFERAEIARQEIINLGYLPISPLDLNKIGVSAKQWGWGMFS